MATAGAAAPSACVCARGYMLGTMHCRMVRYAMPSSHGPPTASTSRAQCIMGHFQLGRGEALVVQLSGPSFWGRAAWGWIVPPRLGCLCACWGSVSGAAGRYLAGTSYPPPNTFRPGAEGL